MTDGMLRTGRDSYTGNIILRTVFVIIPSF